mgnify:FL=1
MGEAKRKGTYEERKLKSVNNKMNKLTEEMIDFSDPNMIFLKKGYEFLKNKIHPNDWDKRRNAIIEYLIERPTDYSSKNSKIRFKDDEIAWYIFLCEEFFRNPLCTNPSQMSRITPWVISLGRAVDSLEKLDNIHLKIIDLLKKYKDNPDGTFFELLVASSYLKKGFKVEFLETKGTKTPDLRVYDEENEFFVECKKLQRRTDYAEKERDSYLSAWNSVKNKLLTDYPNYWFDIEFKNELVGNIQIDLKKKFSCLRQDQSNELFFEDEDVIIEGKKQNIFFINRYLNNNHVKMETFTFSKLLGGEYVKSNSDRTHILKMKPEYFKAASAPVLGLFVGSLDCFCGATRKFTNEISQEKKAKAVGKQINEALDQLNGFKNKVVHVLYEAMEAEDVEQRRWKKVEENILDTLPRIDESTDSIKVHRIQYVESIDQMFDVIETIKIWGRDTSDNTLILIPS